MKALLIIDVQNDFLPMGALSVPKSEEILPWINLYIELFQSKEYPIFASKDWHPEDHCSFEEQGGPWPKHCVQNSIGAMFPTELNWPWHTEIVLKGIMKNNDAYSAFENTNLLHRLINYYVRELTIVGLATEYCIFNTVKDAINLGFDVKIPSMAIKAVNVKPYDGNKAIDKMKAMGAIFI